MTIIAALAVAGVYLTVAAARRAWLRFEGWREREAHAREVAGLGVLDVLTPWSDEAELDLWRLAHSEDAL